MFLQDVTKGGIASWISAEYFHPTGFYYHPRPTKSPVVESPTDSTTGLFPQKRRGLFEKHHLPRQHLLPRFQAVEVDAGAYKVSPSVPSVPRDFFESFIHHIVHESFN